MKKIIGLVWLSAFLLLSCGKKEATPDSITPTNLTLNAVVSNNNSGNVNFTASASNAITYEFDFGNGVFQIVPSGVVTYKYPASGTYTVNVIAKSSTGLTATKSVQVTVAIAFSLVFQDEFDAPGAPDPSKWGYDIGAGGWGNNELEYYTNRLENAAVSNGTLKINAIRESFSGSAFTSARLVSQNKYSFKYGKVEVKAKLPTGVGTWPAIWMLGTNINTTAWPACGEIDIMEHVGSQQNKIYGTLHYPARYGGNADGGTTVVPDASTAFHIYSIEWNAAFIKIFVDGNLFHTVANSATLPFNQNFFFILNFAMGGNFGGPVETGFTKATLEIDYIRVYQ